MCTYHVIMCGVGAAKVAKQQVTNAN
jgi:hypothetical protein